MQVKGPFKFSYLHSITSNIEKNAERAKNIIKEYKPLFKNKEEYLAYCDTLACSGDRIEYSDKEAKIRL